MSGPNPELARALVRWQHAAGPYWPYVGAAPFLAELAPKPSARRRRTALAARLVEVALAAGDRAAIFADWPPTETLPAAPALNRLGFFVVPAIQRWVTSPAVLRSDRLLAELVASSSQIARPRRDRGVVFLLDGDRAGPAGRPGAPALAIFDNRYRYPVGPLPPPSFLQREGVAAVHWLSAAGIASDLQPYARRLSEAGLAPVGAA